MTQRDALLRRFGPLLLEAIVLVALAAINELRVKAGLPPHTPEQFMTAIEVRLAPLEEYSGMNGHSGS